MQGTGNSRCLLKTKHKIHLRTKQACFPAALAQVGQVLPVKFCSQLLWWESFKYQQATAGNTESQDGNLEVCTHSAMWHLLMKGFALPYPYREPKSGILKNGQFNITCPNLPHVWGTWHCSAIPATGTSHPEDKMWICSTSAIPWEYPWRLFGHTLTGNLLQSHEVLLWDSNMNLIRCTTSPHQHHAHGSAYLVFQRGALVLTQGNTFCPSWDGHLWIAVCTKPFSLLTDGSQQVTYLLPTRGTGDNPGQLGKFVLRND